MKMFGIVLNHRNVENENEKVENPRIKVCKNLLESAKIIEKRNG